MFANDIVLICKQMAQVQKATLIYKCNCDRPNHKYLFLPGVVCVSSGFSLLFFRIRETDLWLIPVYRAALSVAFARGTRRHLFAASASQHSITLFMISLSLLCKTVLNLECPAPRSIVRYELCFVRSTSAGCFCHER